MMELLYDIRLVMFMYGYKIVGYLNKNTLKVTQKKPNDINKEKNYIPIYYDDSIINKKESSCCLLQEMETLQDIIKNKQ